MYFYFRPPVEQIDMYKYARSWVEKHRYTDSLPIRKRNRKMTNVEKNENEEDGVFYSSTILY